MYKDLIKPIKDFPTQGINFLDITPMLLDADAFHSVCDDIASLSERFSPQVIVGPESRGFIFGVSVAYKLHAGFHMLRKKGKLPDDGTQICFSADKEYGSSEFAVNKSDLQSLLNKGLKDIVIIDDVLATGETTLEIAKFYQSQGFNVKAIITAIDINIGGAELLRNDSFDVHSVISY